MLQFANVINAKTACMLVVGKIFHLDVEYPADDDDDDDGVVLGNEEGGTN